MRPDSSLTIWVSFFGATSKMEKSSRLIGRVQAHLGVPETGNCTKVDEATSGRLPSFGTGCTAYRKASYPCAASNWLKADALRRPAAAAARTMPLANATRRQSANHERHRWRNDARSNIVRTPNTTSSGDCATGGKAAQGRQPADRAWWYHHRGPAPLDAVNSTGRPERPGALASGYAPSGGLKRSAERIGASSWDSNISASSGRAKR